MKRAVFLDRDGVVNKAAPKGEYILSRRELQFVSGIESLVKYFRSSGFLVIVVTNQQCIGKGLITKEKVEAINFFLAIEVGINKVYYCPHLADDECECRKPKAGMLFLAEHIDNIDLKTSWMIGDSATDIEAGQKAGCKTVLLIDGERNKEEMQECSPDFLVSSLDQIKFIIK